MVIQRYILNKHELKLIKLNSKAQECISRVKAQKILHKHHKVRKKNDKNVGSLVSTYAGAQVPPKAPIKVQQGRKIATRTE